MKCALALAALLPLAACRSDSADSVTPEASTEAPIVEAVPDTLAPEASGDNSLPLTKQIQTTAEGEPVTLDATLVREADFPLPFATYRPEGMTYDWNSGHEGSGAQFSTGSGNLQATLTVFVPATNPGDLDAWVLNVAESMGEPFPLDASGAWVQAAYSFSGIDTAGSIRAGRHAGRAFYVLETLSPEMGDGWAPLADAVVNEWRWLDDGSTLR